MFSRWRRTEGWVCSVRLDSASVVTTSIAHAENPSSADQQSMYTSAGFILVPGTRPRFSRLTTRLAALHILKSSWRMVLWKIFIYYIVNYDPASISNDDGGRLSSGSECDDDDADCDGAADLPNNMTR